MIKVLGRTVFLIVVAAGIVVAQSAKIDHGKPVRMDIRTIAKAANGSIVSIVMSDKDGNPIAQGTGFLVSKDGIILTNYHVIAEGSSAIVKLLDTSQASPQGFDFGFGRYYEVDGVVAADKARDIALIKAHGQNFRMLTLGNSDRVQVGDEVVAIGNPLSLESTVSNGIVSATRTLEDEGGKFLQVTAPISPGSSGGPLFNMAGQVVGITTMKFKDGENLNFAIPINDAKLLLQNQSTRLQNLPNEEEKASNSEGARASVRFHIEAYNPNTRVAKVRQGNKLFTVTVLSASVCKNKPLEEFDSNRDCEYVPSELGTLVGQDIANTKEVRSPVFEGYSMSDEMLHNLLLTNNGHDKNRTEVLWIEAVEEVSQ